MQKLAECTACVARIGASPFSLLLVSSVALASQRSHQRSWEARNWSSAFLVRFARMGKVPIRLKEVVYTISPFETTVMSGLFMDVPKKLAEKIKHNWVDIGLFGALPTYLTMWYAADYKEREKNHHRF